MELSEAQEQDKNEQLERATAFEELIRVKGWKYVLAYYQNRVQALTNGLLLEDGEEISKYESERRELIGIRKLLSQIESDIGALERDRQANKPTSQ